MISFSDVDVFIKVVTVSAPAPRQAAPQQQQQDLHAQLHRQKPSPPPRRHSPPGPSGSSSVGGGGGGGGGGMCDEKTVEYLRDLIAEKHELDQVEGGGSRKAIVAKLLEQGKIWSSFFARFFCTYCSNDISCHLSHK